MTRRRDPLAATALVLAFVAFAGSFAHVRATVDQHGQHGWISWAIASMPEVMVVLAILKVRRRRGDVWAWLVGGSAAGFTLAANLAQAEMSPWGLLVAGWPAWAAVGAAGMIEMARPDPARVTRPGRATGQGQGRVKPQVSPPIPGPVTPPVEPARLHSVTSAPDPGGDPIVAQVEWVREQRAAGVRRADVIRAGVTRWGVSESTMIRRWEAAA